MRVTNCMNLIERDKKVIAPCSHLSYFPLAVASVEGSVITDEDGNKFIDFLSSGSSLNLGSSHPAVMEAVKAQLDLSAQYTQAYSYNRRSIEYAEKLSSVYPGGIDVKVCFGNCGSDANDAAIKFARAYTGRPKIITFINGYHGSTYGSQTLTTCSTKVKMKMGPFLPECYSFPFCRIDADDAAAAESTSQMELAFGTYLPADEVAAVIIEPMQGDGGLMPAHPVFMKKLYELCRANGILFIAEEVQNGCWRTGKMFSIEHYGIVPDGIIMGKAVGAFLTLGCFIARSEIIDVLPAPAHTFTLGGNALACAAGAAAFDVYYSDEFQSLLKTNIALAEESAHKLGQNHPGVVKDCRNLGLSMGIEISDPSGGSDDDATFKILYRCYELGLIVISFAGNVLRIQPPLNIETELLEEGFRIIDQAMCDFEAGSIPDDVLEYKAGW